MSWRVIEKVNVSSDEAEAALYADIVIEHISLDSILDKIDEVHTMTSLVGFEALIRGKKVYYVRVTVLCWAGA